MSNNIELDFKEGSQLFDSQYIINKKIGEGQAGTVYIVHSKDFPDKLLAAKIFNKPKKASDNYWRKVNDEILTCVRISKIPNENLARTVDAFTSKDNHIVLIMDYINGISLRSYLNKYGCLSPRLALNVFKKILNGVKQLHDYDHCIVHGDLKPENIMVSNNLSDVVIIDFSVSYVIQKEDNKILTDLSDFSGTVGYICPDLVEDIDLTKDVLIQSDIFSLGVILYEMIMGTLPFEPIEPSNSINTIKLPTRFDIKNISINPAIPTTLENIIFKCLACKPKDIKYRYSSIDELIKDVEKCLLILDKKMDSTPLIKPVNQRWCQGISFIHEDIENASRGIFTHWYALLGVGGAFIVLTIFAIISIFVF